MHMIVQQASQQTIVVFCVCIMMVMALRCMGVCVSRFMMVACWGILLRYVVHMWQKLMQAVHPKDKQKQEGRYAVIFPHRVKLIK